jgi:hypothetical protein
MARNVGSGQISRHHAADEERRGQRKVDHPVGPRRLRVDELADRGVISNRPSASMIARADVRLSWSTTMPKNSHVMMMTSKTHQRKGLDHPGFLGGRSFWEG